MLELLLLLLHGAHCASGEWSTVEHTRAPHIKTPTIAALMTHKNFYMRHTR